ncbi:hypothetical protein Tco_0833690 [Tanacetum coccineum]
MSKRTSSGKGTSTCKGKASTSTGDGPEGRPTNRPIYVARPPTRLVSRPTDHLVSRPKGVGADKGVGRGGSSSAAGNGDRFADDRGDIGEYIDDENRHVVRPRGIHGGRGGRSSAAGNGDRFADDQGDVDEYIDEGNRHVVRPRDDYVEDLDEGMDELVWDFILLFLQLVKAVILADFTACTPSTPSTGNSYAHQSSVASSEEVENLKGQLAEQEKVAQERERVAKELQQAAEERERAAEQRVKELEEQVKDTANMLKTLKPPPSPPPS